MIVSAPAVYLWLKICLDGEACTEWDAYQIDHFPASATAREDCNTELEKRVGQYVTAPDLPEWRLTCGTVLEFREASRPQAQTQVSLRL